MNLLESTDGKVLSKWLALYAAGTGALRHVPIALRETEEITEMYH